MRTILSPMVEGSGAIVVHRHLESAIEGYKLCPYPPKLEYFPPLMRRRCRQPADIVHTSPDHGFFFSRKETPLVVTFHNYLLDSGIRPFSTPIQRIHYSTDLRFYTRLALKRATFITAVSQYTADLAAEDMRFKGHIEVIPNGVDLELFKPASDPRRESEIRVLFSGNPTLRKGVQWLPDIVRGLSDSTKVIITSGLRSYKTSSSLPNVEWVGAVPFNKMPDLYRQSDMLLLPTVREGMSLAVLEAMASGLPVVATNCSSMPELIEEGKGGYLCPKGNVECFVEAIKRIASDTQLRLSMGRFNRQRAEERFGLNRMVERYRELLMGFKD